MASCIEDYAMIEDLGSAALVGRDGSRTFRHKDIFAG